MCRAPTLSCDTEFNGTQAMVRLSLKNYPIGLRLHRASPLPSITGGVGGGSLLAPVVVPDVVAVGALNLGVTFCHII